MHSHTNNIRTYIGMSKLCVWVVRPAIAQLVERRTVDGCIVQWSLGRWFKSASPEQWFYSAITWTALNHKTPNPFHMRLIPVQRCAQLLMRPLSDSVWVVILKFWPGHELFQLQTPSIPNWSSSQSEFHVTASKSGQLNIDPSCHQSAPLPVFNHPQSRYTEYRSSFRTRISASQPGHLSPDCTSWSAVNRTIFTHVLLHFLNQSIFWSWFIFETERIK